MLGPAAILFAAILWSIDALLRQSLYAAPSFLVITLEHLLGAILFLPLILWKWKDVKTFGKREWTSLLWVSIFGGLLGTFFYTKALSYVGYIDLSIVVLLQKLQPFFAIALAAAVLKERLSSKFFLLAFIAVIGGYLITFPTLTPQLSLDNKNVMAALLAVGAAFAWGSSTVFGKRALMEQKFFLVTGLRLLLTAILGGIVVLFLGQQAAIPSFTTDHYQALIAIVLSTGAVALGIYYYGLKKTPASHATLYELAWPLSAIVIDWAVRGRTLNLTQWLGVLLLLVAIWLLPKRDKKEVDAAAVG